MLFLYALFLRTVDTLRLRREEGQTTAEYALVILAAAAVAVSRGLVRPASCPRSSTV
jgi:hypothetical protein